MHTLRTVLLSSLLLSAFSLQPSSLLRAASYNLTTTDTNAQSSALYGRLDAAWQAWPGTNVYNTILTTNLAMQGGNIALGSGWLSGDGDNEGVSVDASGAVTVSYGASGQYAQVLDTVIKTYFAYSAAANPSWNCFRSGGTVSSPTAADLNAAWSIAYRPYGTSYVQSAVIQFISTETNAGGANGSAINVYVTRNAGGGFSQAAKFDHDRSFRLYNMTTALTTGSGYGVIAATNNEMYVWDGSGNRTLLSPHEDENNELVKRSDNPYTGVSEEINLTRLAQAVEKLLAADDPLKGTIYKRIQSEPSADWRANEKRQAAEREAERAQWDQADTAHKADVAKWEATPMVYKARLTKPTKDDDRLKPEPYTMRTIPSWAAEAQKRFDAKHVEAAK